LAVGASYAKIHQLDFYPPNGPTIHTGISRALGTRPYFDRFFVLPLEATSNPEFFYLRATSRYALTVPLTLWEPDAYRREQQHFQLLQFMYFGGLIILAMYGAMIFLAIRDSRFLIYCAYTVTAGLGIFASNGFGRLFIWPDAAAFDDVAQSAFLSLGAFFAVLFAARILLLATERSWFSRGMQWIAATFLLIFLATLMSLVAPLSMRHVNQLLMLDSLVMSLLVSVACIRAYLQKREGIRYFIVGWTVLWFGIATAASRAFGWIPSNGVTSYAVQLSTVAEAILMALALADLLRIEHEAYGKTQAQALEANRALLDLTKSSELGLKHAVQERTKQLEVALQMEKSLRAQYARFVSMISHEFRTPLGIIQVQASLMRKENERGIYQVTKRLDAVGSAAKRLTVMFDKWLHSDSVSQSLDALEHVQIDIKPWLHAVMRSSSHLLLSHQVDLQLQPAAGHVLADEYHLEVALTNLLDNASKYSPANSTITIRTQLKEGYIGIEVANEGQGIPLEMQEKVFLEFFRLSPENSVGGVGLGLSIVQRIARAHGGHVTLVSTPGFGAAFCIWLPT
jgi:signal transduction histidine kinase